MIIIISTVSTALVANLWWRLQTMDGVELVLAAGTIIPFRAHHTFTLASDQTSFKMVICETGEGEASADFKCVAKVSWANAHVLCWGGWGGVAEFTLNSVHCIIMACGFCQYHF